MARLLCLLALLAGPAWSPECAEGAEREDLETWVRGLGGSIRYGPDGEAAAVDLGRSWVVDLDLERLAEWPEVHSLSLAQTHITDSGLGSVARLPALRELSLFFCEHITDAGAAQLRQASTLERLVVRGTKIGESGVKFLSELQQLRQLDIGITEIGDPSIELLEELPHLESLALGGNRISEVGIAGLRALKRLRHLDLSGAQVTDSGIWAVKVTDLNLGEIGALSGLESLVLAAPNPEYVAAVSSGVPRLRGAIRVTDFGARHLRQLARLRRLDLTWSQLSAEGLEHLSGLERLEELRLAHAGRIDDKAGAMLAAFPALRVLDVSETGFGDAGIAALSGHPTLRRIVAVGTPLSDEAAAAFREARPDCELIR